MTMPMNRSGRALPLVCILLLAAVSLSAQARPPAASSTLPADTALIALNAGRFEQVDSLLGAATDPRSIAVRASGLVQRGRYPEAERLLAGPAAAAPGSDAALELGRLQLYLGRRGEGTRTLERLQATSAQNSVADLVRLGVAARLLGDVRQANDDFRRASALAPGGVTVHVEWGELFLEKYNVQEALNSFQAAIMAAPDDVRAQLGLARVLLEQDPPAAKAAVERALAVNPGYVPGHLLLAEMALDDRRRDDARASIAKALAVNPISLEARTLEAAIAFLEARPADVEARVADILKINPRYGEVYRVVGDHAARNYRFAEAAELVRKALVLDPESSRAQADLGMHLLRTGDEPGARRALDAAFKTDPYDVVTYNLLRMMDTLQTFVTITDGDVIMRLHPDEAAVMREYAMPLAKEALATLATRYGFTPKGPILIEMFPKHDDFAVRNVGLPGMIGALGACFGSVVTVDSPRARKPGEFNWQPTLWHELAHVITLQMSNNRVPRWLTEGISEWEETRARPHWGREMEVTFAQALEAKKTLTLKDLNDGFTNPRLITLAYYEASLLVDHLVAVYGEPALHTLLRAYGRGLETEPALQEAFHATLDQIQSSFDAALEKRFAATRRALRSPEVPKEATVDALRALVQANPDAFVLRMRLAQELRKAGDVPGAIRELERAGQLLPAATGEGNPHGVIAALALERKDTARAIQAFEAYLKANTDDVDAARKLASLVVPLGDAARTTAAYERVVELDPFDATAQTSVGRLAMQRKDSARALRAFRAALASSPTDRAAAHLDLGQAYLASGDRVQAKREALAALEIAPSFEGAQDLLLQTIADQLPASR